MERAIFDTQRLSADLSTLWLDRPAADRFIAAASAGFGSVEWSLPLDEGPAVLAELVDAHRLRVVMVSAGRLAASLMSALEQAEALDAAFICIHPPDFGHRDAAADSLMDWLAALPPPGGRRRLLLTPDPQHPVVMDHAAALEVVRALDLPYLGLLGRLDLLGQEPTDPGALIPVLAQETAHFQLTMPASIEFAVAYLALLEADVLPLLQAGYGHLVGLRGT